MAVSSAQHVEALLVSEDSGRQFGAACFSAASGAHLASFKCNGEPLGYGKLCFISDSYLIGTALNRPYIYVWKYEKKEQCLQKIIVPGKLTAMAITADGKYLFGAYGDKLCGWQVNSGEMLFNVDALHFQDITCLACTSDDCKLISKSDDNSCIIWDVTTLLSTKNPHEAAGHHLRDHCGKINGLYVGAGGYRDARVYTGSSDHTSKVYEVGSGRLLLSLKFPSNVTSICCDASESRFYAGTACGIIYWVDLQGPAPSGEVIVNSNNCLDGHRDVVTAMSVNKDGHRLASGSIDGTVRVWDCLGSGQCVRVIPLRGGPVTNVRFVAPVPDTAAAQPLPLLPTFQRAMAHAPGDRDNRELLDRLPPHVIHQIRTQQWSL